MFDRQQLAPTVLAIGAFRNANGDFPDKLQDLVPDYIEGIRDHLNVTEDKPTAPFRYINPDYSRGVGVRIG